MSAAGTHWPLYARFHLSRAALEEAARAYLDGIRTQRKPGWVGLYRFKVGRQQDGGVAFFGDYGFWGFCGFFYNPNDAPPTYEIDWSRRIAPSWFVFEWDF
ncbi:MAG: hypothetical protein ACE5I3_01375 [Phycisphaerae bacterium]